MAVGCSVGCSVGPNDGCEVGLEVGLAVGGLSTASEAIDSPSIEFSEPALKLARSVSAADLGIVTVSRTTSWCADLLGGRAADATLDSDEAATIADPMSNLNAVTSSRAIDAASARLFRTAFRSSSFPFRCRPINRGVGERSMGGAFMTCAAAACVLVRFALPSFISWPACSSSAAFRLDFVLSPFPSIFLRPACSSLFALLIVPSASRLALALRASHDASLRCWRRWPGSRSGASPSSRNCNTQSMRASDEVGTPTPSVSCSALPNSISRGRLHGPLRSQ